ncbi:MAG: ABC transporter permease [Thermoleophilaceae bacterium]|nr:ABC transporter permease [Thermoleophilaceae bacterium]
MSTTSTEQSSGAAAAQGASRGRRRAVDDIFGERHVYEPHRVGLPPLGRYARMVWRRRAFALELSRTNMRAQHLNTVFGQLWLLLNPVLLGMVYFLLVDLLRQHSRGFAFFAHLLAGLFLYQIVQTSATDGARSVVKGGRLILNTAFPRTLLPIASVITAFKRFLPTLLVYAPIHLIAGLPVDWQLVYLIPVVALMVIFASGLAMLLSAAQVYFRDLSSFLPYVLRIWLYVSPVLYYYDEVPSKYKPILDVNPLTPILASWSDVLDKGHAPRPGFLLLGVAWAAVAFAAGFLFFVSREREFAVRI